MSKIFTRRRALVSLIHIALFGLAYAVAFGLRFDFEPPAAVVDLGLRWFPAAVAIQCLVFGFLGMFSASWRYVGVSDFIQIAKASGLAGTISAVGWYLTAPAVGYPRSVFILHATATFGLVATARLTLRMVREFRRNPNHRRVLVVGAGDAGETLVREIRKSATLGYLPVGFVDDDPLKKGSRIHGVSVLGPVEQLSRLVARFAADEILIACPTATSEQMRRIVNHCKESGAGFKTLPGIEELIDGRVSITRMREVKIEDLLGRGAVELDMQAIGQFIADKVVLVTGAGGSIGSELVRQLCKHGPRRLVALERAENPLFLLMRGLERSPELSGVDVCGVIGDVTDAPRVQSIFREHRPVLVFHAAAHKHVPLMEDNVGEAMKNNILGTSAVADAAARFGATAFVMISTDKAVRPSSIMGATKRAAESYVRMMADRSGTKFLSVRFGNVLGSAGSVVPLFTEQIRRGGPVTVTHPEMERFFMTIPEAVQLVLQAATMGTDREVFILEMGKPVRILDLARDLIKLSGFTPDVDVKIEFTGSRPGEKLREELLTPNEHVMKTRHPKIMILQEPDKVPPGFARLVDDVRDLVGREDLAGLRRKLRELVPDYEAPRETPLPSVDQSVPAAKVISLRS